MTITPINSDQAPLTSGNYSQATLLEGYKRLLFISGQIPETVDGFTPSDFKSQCELAWENIKAQLHAADMTISNLVKITTFLSSRDYGTENSEVRQRVLGSHAPSLTVIITGIYDESWLLEIEAIAAE
ncbi:putative translation initiation inhibitor, yjgF family [Hyella patelloides LEGE 07179]|uniref:Putative translation initiation inhibitor, yjgF family n=1 Tax=Hyella patelloides LEGE 07179 TaxID=945734 RepID=A0A563VZN6_9CYAN|nr:RidA family protein [Hyella patelloides]VEP16855.1 putative translation initiation inhibitor, yjgF family [Hyella patelloides LEGE 07179]